MKKAILILALALSSCASHVIDRQTNSAKEDVLSNESYLRYGPNRIEALIDSKDLLKVAVASCYKKDIQAGLSKLKDLRETHNKSALYWNHMGTCYFLSGQYPKAEFYYSMSINVSNKNKNQIAAPFNNLGMIRLKFGHFEDALVLFKKSLKLSPNFNTPKFNIAQIYIRYSLLDKALPILKELELKAGNDKDIIASLAAIHVLKKDLKEAFKYFSRLDGLDLKREDIAPHYAMALYLNGQYELAKESIISANMTRIKDLKVMNKKIEHLINVKLQELYAKKRDEG